MVDMALSWSLVPPQISYHSRLEQPYRYTINQYIFFHFKPITILKVLLQDSNKYLHHNKLAVHCIGETIFNILCRLIEADMPITTNILIPPCETGWMGCIRYLEHVQLNLTVSASKRGAISVCLFSFIDFPSENFYHLYLTFSKPARSKIIHFRNNCLLVSNESS